jgi:hypothetical protein
MAYRVATDACGSNEHEQGREDDRFLLYRALAH